MKTKCPNCGRTFPIRAEHIGKKGKCPKCGERFVAEEDAAEASIVPDVSTNVATSNSSTSLTRNQWLMLSVIPISFIFFCCGAPILIGIVSPPAAKNVPVQQAVSPEQVVVEEPVEDKCAGKETEAFVYSQMFIKRLLKAPATAEFPWAPDEGFTIRHLGDCKYEVSGYVDSENSFGALIRSQYYIELEYNSINDDWTASGAEIY